MASSAPRSLVIATRRGPARGFVRTVGRDGGWVMTAQADKARRFAPEAGAAALQALAQATPAGMVMELVDAEAACAPVEA